MHEQDREDADIIRAAYAERVKEAFRVFAENIGMGQPEKSCSERFGRSMQLARKARDLALAAIGGPEPIVEPTAHQETVEPVPKQDDADGELSDEYKEIVEHALARTEGTPKLLR